MTLPIAREFARFGIRCVSIAPGIFHTPMMDAHAAGGAGLARRARCPSPRGWASRRSSRSSWRAIFEIPMLNGETIRLDGAIRMQPK